MDFASKFNMDSWVDWNTQYGNVVRGSDEVDEDDELDADEGSTNKIRHRNDEEEFDMPTNNFSDLYDDTEDLPTRKLTDMDADLDYDEDQ